MGSLDFVDRQARAQRERRINELSNKIESIRQQIATGGVTAKEASSQIQDLRSNLEREQRTDLGLKVGPWRFHRNTNAQGVAKLFIALHLVAIIAGAVLIFQRSPMKELGIALVVGGLFAFGTLLSAIWSEIYASEREMSTVLAQPSYAELKADLENHVHALEKELQRARKALPVLVSAHWYARFKNKAGGPLNVLLIVLFFAISIPVVWVVVLVFWIAEKVNADWIIDAFLRLVRKIDEV
jgi:hypothetical protein